MNYHIKVSLDNDEEFSSFLHEKIKIFNDQHSIYHKHSRKKDAIQPLNIMVVKDDGSWIGGLHAEIYWNWIEINNFWIHPNNRGKRLGTMLLEKAENIAKHKGAEKALLTTFEFQARSFYETKGYHIVGEINDYPPGSSYYTMVKMLQEKSSNDHY